MICYQCGEEVGKAQTCPVCRADLHIFQKAIRLSNAYYNDGLEKASVRNLSGAILSLKQSLKLNKYHTDARNLLGLIYYETGDVVEAISEWVISKNYQAEENRASYYLESIQKNRSQLESINNTIKKYNQALLYCKQESRDLAVIQLKKVLSLNPKMLKAHQLLALLYIQEEKYDLAKKTLRNAGKIDTDNTTTLRYLKEANAGLKAKSTNKKSKEDNDLISYQSGNETIIMPKRFKETSVGGTILAMVIGLVIGAAVIGFLVVPGVKSNVQSEAKKEVLKATDTINANAQTIDGLNKKIDELNAQIADAQSGQEAVQSQVGSYEQLIVALNCFTANDFVAAGDALSQVDPEKLNDATKATYTTLKEQVDVKYLEQLFNAGYNEYSQGRFPQAIENLKKVVDKDPNYNDGNAVYFLAQAYRRSDDFESSKQYYQYVIDHYPDTEHARTAASYLQ